MALVLTVPSLTVRVKVIFTSLRTVGATQVGERMVVLEKLLP